MLTKALTLVGSPIELLGKLPVDPGKVDNARLLALYQLAMDDAVQAMIVAKHRYNFWRPVTAIRNGDRDGNDATQLDAG